MKDGPDQARSWAIAMAGCVINGLLSGISRTTGLFYVSLIQTYGVSRMEANLPFTLRNVIRNLGGPLAGAIGQRYGARDVTFIGGIFAFLGITLCSFAPNVTWICVLWGGVHGFGVALGNTLFPVIINQYFLKYRATASGIALSGACIGSFILPAALEYMLNNIGLSGTFLITGGLIMHVLPAAIVMKEPPWIKRQQTTDENNDQSMPNNIRPTSSVRKNSVKSQHNLENISVINITKIQSSEYLCDDDKGREEDSFQPTTRDARVFSRNGVDNLAFSGSKLSINEKKAGSTEMAYDFDEEIRVRTISIGEASVTYTEPPVEEIQETSITKGISIMIRDPMFYVISISLGGFAMVFDPTITVIVDYIKDKGLQENDAKYFISLMSLGDLLGRLCFGWVTDQNYMSLSRFMLLLQVLQGICFLMLPLFRAFDILIIIITIYGLASGATLVMFPILVSKYLASVQSLAIGFISIFTGVISFAIPPLIGYFRDDVGSYEGMFVITGGLSVAAGCLWLFEPLLTRLKKSQRSTSLKISSSHPPSHGRY